MLILILTVMSIVLSMKENNCLGACPMVRTRVCGSDGKTYPNKCALKMADCKSDRSIKAVHYGSCSSK